MDRFILLASILVALSGCESDFDRCFSTEREKLISSEMEKFVAANPIQKAYADLEVHHDRLPAYLKASEEYLSVHPEEAIEDSEEAHDHYTQYYVRLGFDDVNELYLELFFASVDGKGI